MDRDLILKCSRTIRLEHKVPMEFTQVVNEYCIQKGHPEHFNACIHLTQHSMFRGEIIHGILEHFEKEFHIIKLERLPDAHSINQKQLINIYENMEKELSRFELAIVKRTAQNTKALRTKRDKAKAKIEALTAELQEIEAVIEKFEAPVKEITGGLSSEEVLAELAKAEAVETVEEETAEENPSDEAPFEV